MALKLHDSGENRLPLGDFHGMIGPYENHTGLCGMWFKEDESMSMNLIAMLLSLAMMLTGASVGVQPEAMPAAETARTVTLSNIVVTWNGVRLELAPKAHVGVSTDGKKAVYDFGVDLGDKKLLPVQVVASESGITALSGNSGAAVTVTKEALEGLAAQLEAQMSASMAQAGGDNAQIMQFITEEYMPAYMKLLQVAMDPEQRRQIQATGQAVYDRVVDRGEGTPATLEVDGESYKVTAYSYSLDALQMAALADAIYGEVPAIGDYYNALFKLYSMMPEESGLRDVTSFTALFEKFGIKMQMDIQERRNDDGTVDDMDAVLTMDLNAMMTMPRSQASMTTANADATAAPAPEAEAPAEEAPEAEAPATAPEAEAPTEEAPEAEAPALEPIVMNMHSLKLNDYSEATGSCTYAFDAHNSIEATMLATESVGMQELEATVFVSEDGNKKLGGTVSAFMAQDESGATSYNLNAKAVKQDAVKAETTFYGAGYPDGTSENSVFCELRTPELNTTVAFDLDVTADAVVDAASTVKPACVIEDLSEAGMQALGQDPMLIGAAMQAFGSMKQDIDALKEDPGVKSVLALLRGKSLPIDVEELNAEDPDNPFDFMEAPEGDDQEPETGEGDEGDYELVMDEDGNYELVMGDENGNALDFEEEPVEDDGVLAFNQPELTWLPKGWTVASTETDTAYDWVQLSITDADGAECAYAIFFLDPEAGTANYIVQENGKVVDGRMINVTDFGEGGLSVTVSENGMYGNFMFNSEAIELDTIGQIVAGIKF